MSTELTVIPSSALTEQEQADLNASIDSIIAAHKNNRQEINRLVFESVSAMTDSEGMSRSFLIGRDFAAFGVRSPAATSACRIRSTAAVQQHSLLLRLPCSAFRSRTC